MPDNREHRGPHPDDHRLFSEDTILLLRTAVEELGWLLTRGYSMDASLKLVGDRFQLTARQRVAVRRCSCSDGQRFHRLESQISPGSVPGRLLAIDGFNLIITMESALSGGAILVGTDGCYRDLASVHGTFRKVSETEPAVDLILDSVTAMNLSHIVWFLDAPVSNSGQMRSMLELKRIGRTPAMPNMEVMLSRSPDRDLIAADGVVATSDSAVLDHVSAWTNLAKSIISERVPNAWVVDLRAGPAV